ncbi:hypothetical protein JAK47_01765 [Stenotrophomonas maltophilia]|uniref:hypothetical protein n=1 Tax=Stenotrophomonas maltophilia TaxID=40324 RepID=UPI0021CA4D1C|nr:hypothetical protein [Stenotrophomonas maltophilia]MCU1053272.1 hypothetical protein [Stenotrophomonas maltophilia]
MNLEHIDTSTTAGKAEVMRLAAEGRRVACRVNGAPHWQFLPPDPDYLWNWVHCDFAIISEPVGPEEVWATVIDGSVVMDVYVTEQEADAALNRGWHKVKYIRADLAGEKG